LAFPPGASAGFATVAVRGTYPASPSADPQSRCASWVCRSPCAAESPVGIHEIPLSLQPHSLAKLLRAKLVNVRSKDFHVQPLVSQVEAKETISQAAFQLGSWSCPTARIGRIRGSGSAGNRSARSHWQSRCVAPGSRSVTRPNPGNRWASPPRSFGNAGVTSKEPVSDLKASGQ